MKKCDFAAIYIQTKLHLTVLIIALCCIMFEQMNKYINALHGQQFFSFFALNRQTHTHRHPYIDTDAINKRPASFGTADEQEIT